MDKFSGTILSAILVVLCLWLSVYSFPDAVNPNDLPYKEQKPAPETADRNVERQLTDVVYVDVGENASREAEALETRASDFITDPTNEEVDVASEIVDDSQSESNDDANLLALSTISNEKVESKDATELKASERAQGGKYVSIPFVNMDLYHAPIGSPYKDRVITTTRAVVPQLNPVYD